ncbi:MAG: hypothetical protein ACHQZS_08730 [Candidatus Binatales bacterium]
MRLVAQQADRHCFAQKQARLTVRAPGDAREIAPDPQLPSSDAAGTKRAPLRLNAACTAAESFLEPRALERAQ